MSKEEQPKGFGWSVLAHFISIETTTKSSSPVLVSKTVCRSIRFFFFFVLLKWRCFIFVFFVFVVCLCVLFSFAFRVFFFRFECRIVIDIIFSSLHYMTGSKTLRYLLIQPAIKLAHALPWFLCRLPFFCFVLFYFDFFFWFFFFFGSFDWFTGLSVRFVTARWLLWFWFYDSNIALFTITFFSFELQRNPAWIRGNFGPKLNSPKFPHKHAKC